MRCICNWETENVNLKFKLPLTPALLINASICPKASHAFCTYFSIAPPSAATSSSTATARSLPSFPLISSHNDCKRSTRRAAAITRHPALARSRQKSRPIPADAPVTRTTFPARSCHGSNCFAMLKKMKWIWEMNVENGVLWFIEMENRKFRGMGNWVSWLIWWQLP